MSEVTKKVNTALPVSQRSQVFTQADASAGDVILVRESLGKYAKVVQIQADAEMSVRFNVLQTIFPDRDKGLGGYPNGDNTQDLSAGVTIQDTTQTPVVIAASETFTLDKDLAVKDIELVTVSGSFEIFVA